jgi:hypothetical protein
MGGKNSGIDGGGKASQHLPMAFWEHTMASYMILGQQQCQGCPAKALDEQKNLVVLLITEGQWFESLASTPSNIFRSCSQYCNVTQKYNKTYIRLEGECDRNGNFCVLK